MPLRITRASDPITVERLNMVIYGPPGLGKTSLAFTAEAPLLLDFDRGSYRAVNRGEVVQVEGWSDVANIEASDLAPFKTVIIDTAGRALDALTATMRGDPKLFKGGALTLPGWGHLKSRFADFLKQLNAHGKDVIMIAHMDEKQVGDDLVERLDVQGGSKAEIYKAADAMGRLKMVGGKMQLLFSPSDAAFGKNPGQFEPLVVPNAADPTYAGFLGRIIRDTKDRLNGMAEAHREAIAEQAWFIEALPKVADAGGINALIERAAKAGPACKALLHERAKAIGLTPNRNTGAYDAPAKAA